MYEVSDEYKTAINEANRTFYWTGTITTTAGKTYTFGNEDIVKGSGYVSRQCSGSSEIELGSVYAAELGISLFSNIDRYSLYDATITLSFHLKVDDESYEEVPMGVFVIAEADRKIKTIEITAYDCMLNLEKDFNKSLSSAYPYDYLSLMAKSCKVELAQTQEEIEALPNGTELFGIYEENDIETWRDFLYYLAQAMGCFSMIDREGKLKLVPYSTDENKRIDTTKRYTSTFSDFETRYTAVSATYEKDETSEYYSITPDDGLTMNLGTNPLLQYGLDETRERVIKAILQAIAIIDYVPFETDTIGDPALDLGDVIKFTGGHADDSKFSAITSIETKVNGKQTIKCVGKNPRLSEAKSKTDKNIAGLLSSIDANEISIYSYTNAFEIDLTSEKVSVINIEFASGDETDAEFHAEIIMDVSSDVEKRSVTATTTIEVEGESQEISVPVSWTDDGKTEVTVYYVLDGTEIESFYPSETWLSGKHLLTLYYPLLSLDANELHTFEVLIELTGGTAVIEPQNVLATISGQGLGAQERWDGRITVSEKITMFELTALSTNTITDDVVTEFIAPTKRGLTDDVTRVKLTGLIAGNLYDSISFFVPVSRYVIDVSDKDNMTYDSTYVDDDTQFILREEFETSGGEAIEIDSGRGLALTLDTTPFSEITEISLSVSSEEYDGVFLFKDAAGVIYTITDDTLSSLEETELTAEVFQTYGVSDLPDGNLLVGLNSPTIIYWHDSYEEFPKLTFTYKGVPNAQVIYSNNIDMTDSSILGIETVTCDTDENTLFAISFDNGESWYGYVSSAWVKFTEETSGISKSAIEGISSDAWAEVATTGTIKYRFILSGADGYITSVITNFLNTEE